MPRPPILPAIRWNEVFAAGRSYAEWMELGEYPNHRSQMDAERNRIHLSAMDKGALAALDRPVHVVAFAEDWCGDVVRHIPVLMALADHTRNLRISFLDRASFPDVFVRFLTNGGEAIPKFVFLSEQWVECGHWGPMPQFCRDWISRGKAAGDVAAARKIIATIYEKDLDRGDSIAELVHLITVASARRP